MNLLRDISRCENEKCKKKNTCLRYLDKPKTRLHVCSEFNEKDCKFFIENEQVNKELLQ